MKMHQKGWTRTSGRMGSQDRGGGVKTGVVRSQEVWKHPRLCKDTVAKPLVRAALGVGLEWEAR